MTAEAMMPERRGSISKAGTGMAMGLRIGLILVVAVVAGALISFVWTPSTYPTSCCHLRCCTSLERITSVVMSCR